MTETRSAPDMQKDLIRYLLEQVKDRRLDKNTALGYLKYLEGSSNKRSDDVAIIGIACRFPDAENKDEYWQNLSQGRNSIRPFPEARKRDLEALDPNTIPLFNGGFLEEVNSFDNDYFNIPPAVANHMDPYHRLLLESFVETLEDAGYSRRAVQGRNIGVYVGNDHTHRLFNCYLSFIDQPDFNSITGSWTGVLASRIAYLLNLQGPAMVVDTSCSSALVALDSAIKALRSGDCEAALVGAANLFFAPGKGIVGDVENNDFVVRAFDQGASGTVWGEGVASLLIKPLKAALADGDAIYGVVQGVAVNNDGASSGITAPNARAQQQVLSQAWERAGISPEQISYIETHGTGTNLGDPIEIRGISNAMSSNTRRRQFCGIGSVKTNIGHTVGVAGLASLIKVLQSYKHEQIPPSLNFLDPNPLIDFCNSPVYVNDKLSNWPASNEQHRYAGISCFSLCGTNCHVVLRDQHTQPVQQAKRPLLFLLSARTSDLLRQSIGRHLKFYAKEPGNFAHACFTLAVGREHQSVRLAILANDMETLIERLKQARDLLETESWQRNADAKLGNEIWCSVALSEMPQSILALEKQAAAIIRDEPETALPQLAFYHVSGARLKWESLFTAEESKRRHLPALPWQRKKFWLTPVARKASAERSDAGDSLQQQLLKISETPTRVVGVGDNESNLAQAEKTLAWIVAETLGYENLKASDDYYALGGDSILGAKIVHLINQALGMDVQISDLMGASSIGKFIQSQAEKHAQQSSSKQTSCDGAIQALAPAQNYPLSRAQERMFVLSDLVADSSTYNVNALLEIDAIPDPSETEGVLRQLLQRHEILRTAFRLHQGEPRQFVLNVNSLNVAAEYYRLPQGPIEVVLQEWLKQAIKAFDLTSPPLLRVSFAHRDDLDRGFMVIDMHHIVTDGSSMGILVDEYLRLAAGQMLTPMSIQYRDFASWHNQALLTKTFTEHAAYWKQRFVEPVPDATLPLDYPRPSVQRFEGARWHSQFPSELSAEIKALAARQGVSLFMLLNAAFRVLLYKYQVGQDVVLGSPVTGRNHPQLHNLIGMFVNTLALRFKVQPAASFEEILGQIKTTMLEDFSHQDYPFEALVESLALPRDTSRNPVFDIYFVLQNENMGLDGDGVRVIPHDTGTARFDLTLVLREQSTAEGNCINADWEYATALFKESTIAQLARHFQDLLRAICRNPQIPLMELPLLSESETRFLLDELNATASDYPAKKSLNDLFERQVAAHPDRLALRYLGGDEKIQLSYSELNKQANRLAHFLINDGVSPGQVVALYLPRSPLMVVAILATLKIDCTYVPIDPDNPLVRNLDILSDSAATRLLTHSSMPALEDCLLPILSLDQINLVESKDSNPTCVNNGESLAYLMYTSGTTGRPKGACIRHKSVSRVVLNTNYIKLDESDVCLQLSSFSFDGCVPDMFGALLNGGLLVLPSREITLDLPRLSEVIVDHGVTSMFVTTSLFNVMVDNILPSLKRVKNLMFGGEAASIKHVRKAFEVLGPGRLINVYGPTETTVYATASVIDRLDEKLGGVPIGKTISNTTSYVFNDRRELVPLGVCGELYIGGDGVALGYLNRKELTEERFVPNPLVSGDTLYRTGDLVRRLSDGTLLYVSRIDMQVKIRGFRIELEEIRSAICGFSGVTDAVITADADASGTKQLFAWVVTAQPETFNGKDLDAWLRTCLPDYMVPVAVTPISVLPLNLNGKLDRSRLPAPSINTHAKVDARTEFEKQLLKIWCDILHSSEIGIHDNFFALGGDSIKGIRLAARLQQIGVSCSIAELFQFPTIASLAQKLQQHSRDETVLVDQGPVTGELLLNPVQQWFLTSHKEGIGHFNHAMWIPMSELPGIDSLTDALRKLLSHHDILRARFYRDEEGNWQANIPAPGSDQFALRHYCGGSWCIVEGESGSPDTFKRVMELQQSLSLREGVNLAVALFESDRGESAICVAVHHLVIDVVSWSILLEDLQLALQLGDELQFAPKTRAFSDWNRTLHSRANEPSLLAGVGYWSELANKESRELALIDRSATYADCDTLIRLLSPELTQSIMSDANIAFTTEPQHLLLCGLARACDLWRGDGATLIQLESHGRQGLDNENSNLERSLGWFTTVFPHLLTMSGEDLGDSIKAVKERLRAAIARGRDFGLLAWLSNNLDKEVQDNLRAIQPQIGFNFLGSGPTQDNAILPLPRKVTCSPLLSQPLLLDMVLYTVDKQLAVEVLYDRNQFTQSDIDEFLNFYRQALQEISQYCNSQNGSERTASDYTAANLRQDELEDILEDLDIV